MRDLRSDQRIVVTGGAGFLGRRVVAKLAERGLEKVFVARSRDFDLVTAEGVRRMYHELRPDVVIHLAAVVGGIGANQRHPGKFLYDNLMMGLQLMEVGRQWSIEKFVAVGSVCAYPKHATVPFKEDELWAGYPEETNAPYGLAKKMLLVQSQAYRQEYGFNSVFVIPVNLYGPGDNFDPETSHVIPAIVRKCVEAVEAGRDHVVCWGTGQASREFLYVDDAAEGIVAAADALDDSTPVNLGAGREIRISELAGKIAKLVSFEGEIRWDATRPDGQPRRCLDTSRAAEKFGFVAHTSLDEGLARTIDWFMAHRRSTILA